METRIEKDFKEHSILVRMFDGDRQVGVLYAFEINQGRYIIDYLFVSKAYRRQGLGSKILRIGWYELMKRGAWFEMYKWTESQEALLLANAFRIEYDASFVPYLTNCAADPRAISAK